MTAKCARDVLVVLADGEEVPGITVYGLASRGRRRPVTFPADVWIGAPAVEEFVLHGDAWEITTLDLPILVWPAAKELGSAIHASLAALIEAGCPVAWIGAEGLPFCDPPRLFDSRCMSGGVLAWMTADGQFECQVDPNGPVSPISDQQLETLRHHAQGLADAT